MCVKHRDGYIGDASECVKQLGGMWYVVLVEIKINWHYLLQNQIKNAFHSIRYNIISTQKK